MQKLSTASKGRILGRREADIRTARSRTVCEPCHLFELHETITFTDPSYSNTFNHLPSLNLGESDLKIHGWRGREGGASTARARSRG